MSRWLIVVAASSLLLISCVKEEGPEGTSPGAGTPGTPSTAPQASSPQGKAPAAGSPAAGAAADQEKSAAEGALGALKNAVSKEEARVKEAAASAADAGKEALDADAVTKPSFGVDKFKEFIASLDAEKLTQIAKSLVAAIQSRNGVIEGLKEEISKLGVTDFTKAGELKKSLESSSSSVADLKEKLKLVVDKLKTDGADISEFASFLPGA